MASTAGNLLLRAGTISAEKLAAARSMAGSQGYPLAESLVRSGAIDEPTLVDFFARRLMIERLPPSRLHAIPKAVLRLVPPDMANEFRVVPVELSEDGALVIAMADPTDTHAVDEVRFFTDRFVVRTVARLSEIYHALGVYYGADFAPLPVDEAGLESSLPIDDDAGGDDYADYETDRDLTPLPPNVPLGGETPKVEPAVDPLAMPTMLESPVMLTKVKSRAGEIVVGKPAPTGFEAAEPEITIDAAPEPAVDPATKSRDLPTTPALRISELVAKAQLQAQKTPAPTLDSEEPILLNRPIRQERKRTTLTGASGPGPTVPLHSIRSAQSRDEVASMMLDYVAQLCRRSLLMVIRRGQLVGFAARGDDAPRLAQLTLPLDAPTLLRDVILSRLPYRGPLPITEENDKFADALGGVGAEVLVMPITIREKLIALLYADSPLRPLPDAELHAVTREVGLAFERLILEKRPG